MVDFKGGYSFSDLLDDETDPTLSVEDMGDLIWDRLLSRDIKYGGYTSFFVGSPGQGKTSAMLTLLDTTLRRHPEELILWAEPHGIPIQFLHSTAPSQILVDDTFPLALYEIPNDGSKLKPSNDYKVRYFRKPSEALRFCKPGVLNAVYFNPEHIYKWVKIMNTFRFDSKWENVFFDEAESIFPLRVSGKQWHMGDAFSDSFKELRKSRVNMYFNSQQKADVDHRIVGKLNMVAYFRGARVDKYGPVWQKSIHKLEQGQAYVVVNNADFGTIRFQKYEPQTTEYVLKQQED